MKKILFLLIFFGFVACKESAESIVEKNIQVRGGRDSFNRIQTLFIQESINTMGLDVPVKLYISRPNTMRTEVNFGGQSLVTILLPDTAIAIVDNNVTSLPPEAKTEMKKNLENQLDYLRSEFFNLEQRGGKILGITQENFKGKQAHKFKVSYSDGSISYLYIDRSTYLNLGTKTEKIIDGKKMELETVYSDYRKFVKLMVPTKTEVYNGKT
ncbi:MAG: hypothetical protein ACK42Z_09875, partial [Candidatus Kapaibacteriota bacterium]